MIQEKKVKKSLKKYPNKLSEEAIRFIHKNHKKMSALSMSEHLQVNYYKIYYYMKQNNIPILRVAKLPPIRTLEKEIDRLRKTHTPNEIAIKIKRSYASVYNFMLRKNWITYANRYDPTSMDKPKIDRAAFTKYSNPQYVI